MSDEMSSLCHEISGEMSSLCPEISDEMSSLCFEMSDEMSSLCFEMSDEMSSLCLEMSDEKLTQGMQRRVECLTLGCHLTLLLLTVTLIGAGYDLLPVDFSTVPLELTEDEAYLRVQAWINRDNDPNILPKVKVSSPVDERSTNIDTIQLIFEGENVFSKESFQALSEVENKLTSTSGYADYCQLTTEGRCKRPQSVLRFFDGTLPHPVFNDTKFENIGLVLRTAKADAKLSALLDFHLGKDFRIENGSNKVHGSITRSLLFFGFPLDGFTDTEDKDQKQWNKVRDFLVDNLRDRLYDLVENGYSGMDIVFYSNMLFSADVSKQVGTDLLLAAASLAFIFLVVLFQTQSLFISSLALFSIFTSFTGANLIYRVIFDYKYFGIFHVLSVFIILGIGADDIFVFYDTWRATRHVAYPSLAHRLSACYRQAALAMLITSVTTMTAFIANAFSPLLAISSFGLFSGILVFVNYVSVVSFFPCVVVVYHLYWSDWSWPCFRKCSQVEVNAKITDSAQDLTPSETMTSRKNPVVRFFGGPYFKIVTHKIAKWCILVVCFATLSCFIFFSTKLQPDEEPVRIFKSAHNYQRALDKASSRFVPSREDRVVKVYLIWGLRTQDRSKCHRTNFFNCKGETIWDDSFDLNPKPAQVALQRLCDKIRKLSEKENEALFIRRSPISGLLEVNCFLDGMDKFLQKEDSGSPISDFRLPVTEISMIKLMAAHPDIYNMSILPDNFYRFFEVGLRFWLTDGYSGSISLDAMAYSDLLGESIDQFDTVTFKINATDYRYGTRLRYAAVVVNTSLSAGNMGYQTGLPIQEAWEKFTREQMKSLSPTVSSGYQCTPEGGNQWHWLKVQQTLARNAVQGIIIGICLAFPILVLATQNLVLGFLATLTICCITVTVVGLIPMVGWKLGVLESLNLSLVVGLAVDYVVHLAEGYHISACSDRAGRVRDMLDHVGVSVISGACTTLGASLFMLFAQILFFMQFAIFMFSTIGFSLLYSMCVFTTVMALIGPEGNSGSMKPFFRIIWNKIRGRKPGDVNCQICAGKGFHSSTGVS
ncbi:protein dispatched homolog 3-like [Liolophura sinensis]|uniref:protein dispatched homolog 3-like n=1 Tax=Liolophura sinensis TaxID=3198878 RepID=UPI0031580657